MAKIDKTAAQWQQQLTDAQYRVTRLAGTERPFSGEYVNSTDAGIYHCICCDTPLFNSEDKFDAGCGWPSFSSQLTHGLINHQADHGNGLVRTEVRCEKCDAHLGHVFDDGPAPTGLRYCINSVAILFHEQN